MTPTQTTIFCSQLLGISHGGGIVGIYLDPTVTPAAWTAAVVSHDKKLTEKAHGEVFIMTPNQTVNPLPPGAPAAKVLSCRNFMTSSTLTSVPIAYLFEQLQKRSETALKKGPSEWYTMFNSLFPVTGNEEQQLAAMGLYQRWIRVSNAHCKTKMGSNCKGCIGHIHCKHKRAEAKRKEGVYAGLGFNQAIFIKSKNLMPVLRESKPQLHAHMHENMQSSASGCITVPFRHPDDW